MYNRRVSQPKNYRIRKKKRLNFKRLLLSITFLCIISLMPMAYSSFFAIKRIEIIGNKTISTKEILKAVQNYENKNLLTVKPEAVKKMIQETIPVKEVKTKYKLPNTLVVNVKERDIAAALHYLSGFALIDTSGIVVKLEDRIENYSIPIVTGLNVVEANIAKKPVFDKNGHSFEKLLGLLVELESISSELSEINVLSDERGSTKFYLYTLDGYQVYLGDGNDKKTAILKDLLADVRNKSLGKGLLDISNNLPVFRPFNQETVEEGR